MTNRPGAMPGCIAQPQPSRGGLQCPCCLNGCTSPTNPNVLRQYICRTTFQHSMQCTLGRAYGGICSTCHEESDS